MTEHQAVHPDAHRWGGWLWRKPSHGEHFRTCSYCGSVHPDDLAAEPVWHANWADRKYGWPHKFYVNIPSRDPGALFVVGSTFGGVPDQALPPGYTAWDDLTDDQRALYERDHQPVSEKYPAPRGVMFGTRPNHFGKFYSIHLSDPAISAETKVTIGRRSGLRFAFADDGKIGWWPWPADAQTAGL